MCVYVSCQCIFFCVILAEEAVWALTGGAVRWQYWGVHCHFCWTRWMVAAIIVILCSSPLEMWITFLSFVLADVIQHNRQQTRWSAVFFMPSVVYSMLLCVWGLQWWWIAFERRRRGQSFPLVAAPLASISCVTPSRQCLFSFTQTLFHHPL